MTVSTRGTPKSDAQYHHQHMSSSDIWILAFVLPLLFYLHGSVKQKKTTCSRKLNFLADHFSRYTGLWYEPYYTNESNPTAPWMIARTIMACCILKAAIFDECAGGNLIVPRCESLLYSEPNPTDTWIIAWRQVLSHCVPSFSTPSNGGVLNSPR